MIKEIGGDFNISFEALESKENHFTQFFNLEQKNYLLVDSGRTALYMTLKDIISKIPQKPIIFVPNYLCESVITPIRQLDIEIRYYNVFENQKFHMPVITNLPDYSIVLRICFFGSPDLPKISSLNREKIFIVDDLSHNPYLINNTNDADYTIVSLRKFFPIPDGGLLISNDPFVDIIRNTDTNWSDLKTAGMILKNEYLKNPILEIKEKFLSILRKSERALDDAPFKETLISNLSLMILNSIDFESLKLRRIKNYTELYKGLLNLGIQFVCDNLIEKFIPLGFPILTKTRDEIKQKLIKADIYPPVHWKLDDIVPTEHTESHTVSNKIMTIPIDQRYNTDDIQRIIEVMHVIFS